MTELAVVRHGQSTWNVRHRFTGQADPPLSELGRRQAAALAQRCRDLGVEAVVASDLRRAGETAAVVAEELGLGSPVELPDLRERWSDTLTGRLRDDIEAAYPGQLAAWREARPVSVPGRHEPFGEFAERVVRGLVEAAGYGERVLVVAHAGIFVVLGRLQDGAPVAEVANAEGRSVTVDGGRIVAVGSLAVSGSGPERTGVGDF